MLAVKGLAPPKAKKTGTTIVGCVFKVSFLSSSFFLPFFFLIFCLFFLGWNCVGR